MGLSNLNESELIEGCIKGDRSCQNALYSLFAPKMMVVCYRYSRNIEDAEDTLIEAFMKVFDNVSKFRKEGSFEGWIRKIMVNTAISKFKNNNNPLSVVVDFEKVHYLIPSGDDILSNIEAKGLMNMIQHLPPAYQMVFNLYSFEGLKHKEIAEKLGISEGTSKSNLSDARNYLKKIIEKQQHPLVANKK